LGWVVEFASGSIIINYILKRRNKFMDDNKSKKLTIENESSNLRKDDTLKKGAIDTGGAILGSIIGISLGGPIGGIIGAASTPLITTTYDIIERSIKRKEERTQKVIKSAFDKKDITAEEMVSILNKDDKKTDEFLKLLKIISESDFGIDEVLSLLSVEFLLSNSNSEQERLIILIESIRSMTSVHFKILKVIFDNNGIAEASKIALAIQIPEIELRNVVRDLELRGMIKDTQAYPIKWELRELGSSIINFTKIKEKKL